MAPVRSTRVSHPHTFPGRVLRRRDLDPDPLVQIRVWLAEAIRADSADPRAMTLATTGRDGTPAARTVTLKAVDDRGLLFTSRTDSEKAREMQETSAVALVLYWPDQGRQVRVAGTAEPVPADESARLLEDRSRSARLALLAFPQGQPIPDRAALDCRVADLDRQFGEHELPVPLWGGFVVRPHTVECWQGQTSRLHDRFLYRRSGETLWTIDRLAP